MIEAGFTAAELRAVASELAFAAIAAEEIGRAHLRISGVEWTEAKIAAFEAWLREQE